MQVRPQAQPASVRWAAPSYHGAGDGNTGVLSPYSTSYTVNGVERQEIYEKYGRQYFLGLSYHF